MCGRENTHHTPSRLDLSSKPRLANLPQQPGTHMAGTGGPTTGRSTGRTPPQLHNLTCRVRSGTPRTDNQDATVTMDCDDNKQRNQEGIGPGRADNHNRDGSTIPPRSCPHWGTGNRKTGIRAGPTGAGKTPDTHVHKLSPRHGGHAEERPVRTACTRPRPAHATGHVCGLSIPKRRAPFGCCTFPENIRDIPLTAANR